MAENSLLIAVLTAWSSELGQAPLPTTSWEEAGGDSIHIMSFLSELEKIIGQNVPPELLSLEMTPSSLARDLAILCTSESEAADRRTQMAPLVFLMPWLGGDHRDLGPFRADLKGKIRFVVIGYPSWRELIEMGGTFDAIVDAVCEKILASKVTGLYLLAGDSSGGFVAWETARRLVESGRSVGFVGLLDTRHPKFSRGFRPHFGLIGLIRDFLLNNIFDPFVGYLPLPMVNAMGNAVENLLPPPAAFKLNQRLTRDFRYRALRNLVLRPLQVPTYLFRSGDLVSEPSDHGWQALCSQLTIIPITGPHTFVHEKRSREFFCQKFLKAVSTIRTSPHSQRLIRLDDPDSLSLTKPPTGHTFK